MSVFRGQVEEVKGTKMQGGNGIRTANLKRKKKPASWKNKERRNLDIPGMWLLALFLSGSDSKGPIYFFDPFFITFPLSQL